MIEAVAVDFDGVIHDAYDGWRGGEIYGHPLPGAIDALHELMNDHPVFIMTARPDLAPVAAWLENIGFTTITQDACDKNAKTRWHTRGTLLVTNVKLPAIAYIDDKGFGFESWDEGVVGWVNRIAAVPGEVRDAVSWMERKNSALEAKAAAFEEVADLVHEFGDAAYDDRGHRAAEAIWAASKLVRAQAADLRKGKMT
jgi:hypothetical protein